MLIIMKYLLVSGCLLFGIVIFVADQKTFKETVSDKIIWGLLQAYAVAILFAALYIGLR